MKKFLSSLLLALTVIVAASPAFADGESISSVTVVGATEQNGTPTPNTPVAINTNNGVLKVNRNLYSTEYHNKSLSQSDGVTTSSNSGVNVSAMVNCTNVKSFMVTSAEPKGSYRLFKYRPDGTFIEAQTVAPVGQVLVLPSDCGYFRIQYVYAGTGTENILIYDSAYNLNEIYTDGRTETIADSANHTATVATLLSVGDYADEQNINTGVVTHKVGVKVLDGTENWSTTYVSNMYCMQLVGVLSSATSAILHSNYFEGIDEMPSAPNNREGKVTRLNDRVCVGANSLGALDAFKSWLASQYAAGTPVIVVYPLATETTENVAAQTMTTAPVTQTNGMIATTIRTLLQNGQTLVSNSLELSIKIATTAYNAAAFAPVEAALETAVTTIKDVVANTIVQADAIQNLQDTKQTMPDASGTNGTCPKFRQCLLIETDDGTPQWFPIIDPFKDFVTPILANNDHITPVETQRRYYGDQQLCTMLADTDLAKCDNNTAATYNNAASYNVLHGALNENEWGYEFKATNIGANPATDNPNNDEGIVYGISKCVSTDIPAGTYAQPATSTQLNNALWNARPTTMAEADKYRSCWCKATGIAYGGQYYETSAAPWVFVTTHDSAGVCAHHCASNCADHVRYSAGFRSTVLGWAVE